MIDCYECGRSQYPGALFCRECGADLSAKQPSAPGDHTQRFVLPFRDEDDHLEVPPALIGQQLTPFAGAKKIDFLIPSSGRHVTLAFGDVLRVGRTSVEDTQPVELDLAADNGAQYGVSRQHAVIHLTDEGVTILDLGSTNGTYLNGRRLPPELPYPLSHGAEVRFGTLVVHVFLA